MSSTATASVFSLSFGSSLGLRRPLTPRIWTLIGGLSIPLWATWPALSLATRDMPPLECLTIAFLVGWCILSRLEGRPPGSGAAASPASSWIPAVAFALGISGSAGFFLWATRYIGAAQANLITYLWPAMIVAFGAILGIFRLRPRHVLGIALGFFGAAILIGVGPLRPSYPGIGFALLAGASWALYCVFRLIWKGETGRLLTRGFGLSAILCATLHLLLEHSVVPGVASAAAAVLIGIAPTALANLAWDRGFRSGDSQLLAVAAYGTPLCSTLLLATLGLQPFTWQLLVGAIAIVAAGLLSRTQT